MMINNSLEDKINKRGISENLERNSQSNGGISQINEVEAKDERSKDSNSISSISSGENIPKRGRGRPPKSLSARTIKNNKGNNESSEGNVKRLKDDCKKHPSKTDESASEGETESKTESSASCNERSSGKCLVGRRPRGRPPKRIISEDSSAISDREEAPSKRRSRSRSKSLSRPKRRGRPPKRLSSMDSTALSEDEEVGGRSRSRSKSVSRPKPRDRLSTKNTSVDSASASEEERSRSKSITRPKRRGRPPKRLSSIDSVTISVKERGRSRSLARPKRRGRPSKRFSSFDSPSLSEEEEEEEKESKSSRPNNRNGVKRSRSVSMLGRKVRSSKRYSSIDLTCSDEEEETKSDWSESRNGRSRSESKHNTKTVADLCQVKTDNKGKEGLRSCRSRSITRSRSASRLTHKEFDQIDSESKSEDLSEAVCKKIKLSLEKPLPKITGNKDIFCWQCHRNGSTMLTCQICPRVYHKRCAKIDSDPESWVCIECNAGMKAGSFQGRSEAMKSLTQDKFNQLLKFVMERIYSHEGSDHFKYPVDLSQYQKYKDFVVHPMDLSLLEKNINNSKYQSTESFLADLKWLQHNSYVFNSAYSELTSYARGMVKIAKQETEEIENCPNCYYHYHTMDDDAWFIEPCKKPHLLVWAKLRGFPHWPAKIMRIVDDMIDVRFFGDHNRAWLPPENCYLFSKSPPFLTKTGNQRGYDECIKEIFIHIKKLKDKFGEFCFFPVRMKYLPSEHMHMVYNMLPPLRPTSQKLINQAANPKSNDGNAKMNNYKSIEQAHPKQSLTPQFNKSEDIILEKMTKKFVSKNIPDQNTIDVHSLSKPGAVKVERNEAPTLKLINSPISLNANNSIPEKKSISVTKINSSPLINGKINKIINQGVPKYILVKRIQDSKLVVGHQRKITTSRIIKIVDKSPKDLVTPSPSESSDCTSLNKGQNKSVSSSEVQKNIEQPPNQRNENSNDLFRDSSIEIKEECRDFTDNLSKSTSSVCDAIKMKEPRVILTKLSSTENYNSGEADAPVSPQLVMKSPLIHQVHDDEFNTTCGNQEEISDFSELLEDQTINKSNNNMCDSRSNQQLFDEHGYAECVNVQGNKPLEELVSSSKENKEIDGEVPSSPSSSSIRLKVKSSAELLSSEALKRHKSQEIMKNPSSICTMKSYLSAEEKDSSSDSINVDKQDKTLLPPLPEMEVINLCEEEDRHNSALQHMTASIEKVVHGNITVSISSFLSKRKLPNKPEQPKQAMTLDSESEDSEGEFYMDELDEEDLEEEEDDVMIDVNPGLDLELTNQSLKDVSAWSFEPYLENKTVLDSMNEIFSSIEKAQNVEICKNLMFKFRKLAFLQRTEIKNLYQKMKKESSEVYDYFQFENDKLIEQKKELAKKVKKIKLTQWCSFCLREANFYCCWGTSYCSKRCQLNDWEKHYEYCRQSDTSMQDDDRLRVPNPKKSRLSLPPAVTLNKVSSTQVINKDLTNNQQTSKESFPRQPHMKSLNTPTTQLSVSKPVFHDSSSYPKTVCQVKLAPSQFKNTPPSTSTVRPYILAKPSETVTPQSGSFSSKPNILRNNNQVFKICSSNSNEKNTLTISEVKTDYNKILIRNENHKSTNDAKQPNMYNVPLSTLTTASGGKKSNISGKYEQLYVVNKNSVPCLVRPLPANTLPPGGGKIIARSAKVNIPHIEPIQSVLMSQSGTTAS